MNPAEKIQAASDKLERQRAASTRPGPWKTYTFGILQGIADRPDFDPEVHLAVVEAGEIRVADSNLIVTLHRTIDAQLAILRSELEFVNRYGWPPQPFPERLRVLALADAILGDSDA